jgi:2-methylcitrate dehydratase PrpD
MAAHGIAGWLSHVREPGDKRLSSPTVTAIADEPAGRLRGMATVGDDASLPSSTPPLAWRLAQRLASFTWAESGHDATEKARLCLYDLIGCALESVDKPPSRHARAVAVTLPHGHPCAATIIGADVLSSTGDAALANGVAGHGLVREDMHAASISHLGVAVLPALLALTEHTRVSGRDLLAAIVAGYEVGARVGSALMDPALARVHRPTGITGPLAAAAGGARLLGLDVDQTAHAIALAANCTGGLNQWGHTGGSEMYFHPGFAARNGVTAALLARAGAFASPSALDGEAGLFASLGKRSAADGVRIFDGPAEILSVYHKPVPACNFAQTACQAALRLVAAGDGMHKRIAALSIRVPRAGAVYPGCDFRGPFRHALQAKMSIQYNVCAALVTGTVDETNFELLQDERVHRLMALARLEVDEEMTRAYPGLQAGAVEVQLVDGTVLVQRLPDVIHATAQQVRQRFHAAATARLGGAAASRIAELIDGLAGSDDAGQLARALGRPVGLQERQG